MINRRLFLGTLAQANFFCAGLARADSDIFTGKAITYIVATKAGGGYDSMGRLVAKYLQKHLTGSTVVVKNVPGAGHLVGAETIYSSPPDGLTIGTFNTGLLYSEITGRLEGKIALEKMSWIGKAASESRVVMVAANSDLKSVEDFKNPARQIKIGASGKGSAGHFDTTILARTLGWNIKMIFGFEGTEGEMSLLRGEIDAVIGSRSSFENYVGSGQGRFILEIGGKRGSDVPQFESLATTAEAKSAVAIIIAQAHFSRVTVGPPGIPADRLAILREAYMAALADPELIAEAEKMDLPIDAASGEAVAGRIRDALAVSPEILAMMKEVMDE